MGRGYPKWLATRASGAADILDNRSSAMSRSDSVELLINKLLVFLAKNC